MQNTNNKRFYSKLCKLALPIVLQNLITVSVNLTDTMMIGRLGDSAVSGIYMGNQVEMLLHIFSVGVEGAMLMLSARHLGKEDTKQASRLCALGTLLLVGVGALLTIVCTLFPRRVVALFTDKRSIVDTGGGYLALLSLSFPFFCITQALIASARSAESTKIGLYTVLIGFATNAFFDYLLIFGKLGAPELGIRGAAIAAVIARSAEAVIVTAYLFVMRKREKISINILSLPEKKSLVEFLKYGAPIILCQVIWAVNTLSGTAIMGRQGSASAVTALSISSALNNLVFVLANGVSTALGIIIAKAVGGEKKEEAWQYARKAQFIFLGLGILTSVLLQLSKPYFISLYSVSNEAMAESGRFINVLSVTALGTCYQSVCMLGILKSSGDVNFVFGTELASVFLAVIPAGLILSNLNAPSWAVFVGLKCDQFLKCIPAFIRVNRKKWLYDASSL